MLYICLNNVQIDAPIGVHQFEKEKGNQFLVTLKVGIADKEMNDDINHTLNYEVIAGIIKSVFDQPLNLLETVAYQIEKQLLQVYPLIEYFFISVKKINPPLTILADSTEIILEKKYN